MTNKNLSCSWERWVENSIQHKKLVSTSLEIVMRWKNTAAAHCLEAWYNLTQEEARRRELLRRVFLRIQN